MIRDICIADFDYPLPDERIARHPLAERDRCRLLLSRPDGGVADLRFDMLAGLLPPSCLLVVNDTRVINARMEFHKESGARIEIFLLEPNFPEDYVQAFQARGICQWNCMVGNLKRWKNERLHKILTVPGHGEVSLSTHYVQPEPGNAHMIEFEWNNDDVTFAEIVEAAGNLPIPPYLKRPTEERDTTDYQTVYADVKGSVAAPTAGLHFTERVLADIRAHNIDIEHVTLHVGAGTFQPVKSETIGGHPMHTETISIERDFLRKLIDALRADRKVVAVGTTSVRTLESLPILGRKIALGDRSLNVSQWDPYPEEGGLQDFDTVEALEALLSYMDEEGEETLAASTSVMIAPGFKWRIVDGMVTNFHQPQSTLLLLVSSFLDRGEEGSGERWRLLYDHALANPDYRFLSYGDACLLYPPTPEK